MNSFDLYDSILFDCDGVIFDSNTIKESVLSELLVEAGFPLVLVEESICINKGQSRMIHFRYCEKNYHFSSNFDYKKFQEKYSAIVMLAYKQCKRFDNFSRLKKTLDVPWALVSSSDQCELRTLFREMGIDKYFEHGIWGGPQNKNSNFLKLKSSKNFESALYIGDGLVDNQLCLENKIDFLFFDGWTSLNKDEFLRIKSKMRYSFLDDLL